MGPGRHGERVGAGEEEWVSPLGGMDVSTAAVGMGKALWLTAVVSLSQAIDRNSVGVARMGWGNRQ